MYIISVCSYIVAIILCSYIFFNNQERKTALKYTNHKNKPNLRQHFCHEKGSLQARTVWASTDIHKNYEKVSGKTLNSSAYNDAEFALQYAESMFFYNAAISQLTTKLEILDEDFQRSHDRNPIESIKSRVKSLDSIADKMKRKGLSLTIESLTENIHDMAGLRVVCPFINDVYHVADMLLKQDDIVLIRKKDFIKEPKSSGYRSLHLIVTVKVYFSDGVRDIPVEIQLRTIAMNFWASTDHFISYKNTSNLVDADIHEEMKKCAELMADADVKMQALAEKVG